ASDTPPYYVALTLTHFSSHQRPRGTCDLDRAVGRIVVVNVDRGFGQRSAEIGDHLGNGRFLVEAGYQDCHPLPERAAQSVRASRHLQLRLNAAPSAPADPEVLSSRQSPSRREYENGRGVTARAVELHDRFVRGGIPTAGVNNRHSRVQCNRLG